MHRLPRAQALVETLFVRRDDAYVSSALEAFVITAISRVRPIPLEALPDARD